MGAERELFYGAEWYRARSVSAAQNFQIEIESKIKLILEAPERWPIFEAGSRRIVLNKFPYSIVYRIAGGVIHVLAVMHNRRKPGYWIERTKSKRRR